MKKQNQGQKEQIIQCVVQRCDGDMQGRQLQLDLFYISRGTDNIFSAVDAEVISFFLKGCAEVFVKP